MHSAYFYFLLSHHGWSPEGVYEFKTCSHYITYAIILNPQKGFQEFEGFLNLFWSFGNFGLFIEPLRARIANPRSCYFSQSVW